MALRREDLWFLAALMILGAAAGLGWVLIKG